MSRPVSRIAWSCCRWRRPPITACHWQKLFNVLSAWWVMWSPGYNKQDSMLKREYQSNFAYMINICVCVSYVNHMIGFIRESWKKASHVNHMANHMIQLSSTYMYEIHIRQNRLCAISILKFFFFLYFGKFSERFYKTWMTQLINLTSSLSSTMSPTNIMLTL